ncbi:hypothetical protein Lal_00029594 [Lupinus albus]|uniref:Putative pyroglutamyl-peptidase I n=1 Tax=Lupinus albus TaxID=3870 RepID=A0A6A5MN35_LUPAL|nr:putative pyroglutamyl-peptidase I [Lupinus albus]KAF1873888.1 hypothetical protein Lal_00029594 [Lupinus albus]
MGSEVTIHVTGFKKFGGVDENPTEAIVNNLKGYVERRGLHAGVTLGTCTVLEVAGDRALQLYQTMESVTSKTDDISNANVVWLHLGVNSGAQRFAIERQAANEATFLCPDELGWQPYQVPIVPEDGGISRKRETCLSVEAILKSLKKGAYDVMISDDAGRFVCNYLYYHSLRFAEQMGSKSLFVHVPLFSRIDEETQMQFTASLLEAIASAC